MEWSNKSSLSDKFGTKSDFRGQFGLTEKSDEHSVHAEIVAKSLGTCIKNKSHKSMSSDIFRACYHCLKTRTVLRTMKLVGQLLLFLNS